MISARYEGRRRYAARDLETVTRITRPLVSSRDRREHFVQKTQCAIHRFLVVRHGHEVVRRALEEEPPCGTAPRHVTRNVLARKMEKTHLRDPGHARH